MRRLPLSGAGVDIIARNVCLAPESGSRQAGAGTSVPSHKRTFVGALDTPKSGHRMAAEGMPFPWRWNGGTIYTVLDVIWGMSIGTSCLLGKAGRWSSSSKASNLCSSPETNSTIPNMPLWRQGTYTMGVVSGSIAGIIFDYQVISLQGCRLKLPSRVNMRHSQPCTCTMLRLERRKCGAVGSLLE